VGNPGDAVALDGNGHTALLGAPNQGDNGAVDVFTLTNGTWHKTGVLTVTTKNLGQSVAINAAGTIALLGATPLNVYGESPPGAAEVFVLKAGKWHWSHELNLGKHATGSDNLGTSVALNAAGTVALIGAPGRTVKGQQGAGAGELFRFTKGYWSAPTQIDLGSKAVQSDGLGTSVALNAAGSMALLGAPSRTVGATITGAGEIFSIH